MKPIILCTLLLGATSLTPAQAPAPKIQALIITGQNGHDWRATTPVLRGLLEATGKFEVRVTEEFRGVGPESRPCVRSRKRLAARWRRDSRKGNYRDMEPLVGGGGFEPP